MSKEGREVRRDMEGRTEGGRKDMKGWKGRRVGRRGRERSRDMECREGRKDGRTDERT